MSYHDGVAVSGEGVLEQPCQLRVSVRDVSVGLLLGQSVDDVA